MADDLLAQLRAVVGETGPVQVARHAIGTAAIADWCDAIGDTNPCYTDPASAADSVHGGLVAPPATLDIWNRPGAILSVRGTRGRGTADREPVWPDHPGDGRRGRPRPAAGTAGRVPR